MKNGDVAVYQVVKDMQEGKFQGGRTIELGLADDGAVGIAPTSDKNVKPEILKKVEEITKKINSVVCSEITKLFGNILHPYD